MVAEAETMQPVIETERFDLRPLRLSDKGLIELYAGDERVARNTSSIPHPMAPGVAEDFIRRAGVEGREEDVWAIDATKTGGPELMGLISLKRMDRQQSEVGYWVAPAFWNTGLAQEAVAAMIEANPQGAETFFASVFQDNPASARVLTNQGFVYLGDAETFSVARNAKVATWTYSLKRI
ncbi:GNAT family N-acetyltransferase [Rhodalgimonas zhirmunskyi]|uniref:GNAT family N-acetyltransferase n=1 Tax=Rhodalgimonas zhirmunskyi TaxID=2964767 RepID=A0AAJ1U7F9_9RHOB|nr:GNAT family protein [Rhodoalgimonas zhirmunskyi]MDQ2093045.1 GNAT family N-acetyltransferase [Rhodoalgimonas zhirmunskyi]